MIDHIRLPLPTCNKIVDVWYDDFKVSVPCVMEDAIHWSKARKMYAAARGPDQRQIETVKITRK